MKDWRTLYIIPTDLCRTDIPRENRLTGNAGWGKTEIPGDPSKALLDVDWESDPNRQAAFEALPGVLPLGFPWEPLPAEAVTLLASVQHFDAAYAEAYAHQEDPVAAVSAAYAAARARLDPAAASIVTIDGAEVAEGDSVARGLQKIGRRFWR